MFRDPLIFKEKLLNLAEGSGVTTQVRERETAREGERARESERERERAPESLPSYSLPSEEGTA